MRGVVVGGGGTAGLDERIVNVCVYIMWIDRTVAQQVIFYN